MVSLLRRRAMMVQAASPTPSEWDFEWDYTMGLLENQPGWNVRGATEGTSTLESNGERIAANNANGARVLEGASGGQWQYMTNAVGVMEIVVVGSWRNGSTIAGFRMRIGASDTSKRLSIYYNNGKIRLANTNNISTGTQIATASNNVEYTFRLVMRDTVGDVYMNGTQIASDVLLSSIKNGGQNDIVHNSTGSTLVKSVKIKNGRI